jgi:hypothetical protein
MALEAHGVRNGSGPGRGDFDGHASDLRRFRHSSELRAGGDVFRMVGHDSVGLSGFWRDMRWVLAVVILSALFPWIRYLVELIGAGPNLHMEPFGFVYGAVSVVQTFIYFAALLWLGMYFGYAKHKVAVAAGWTVLCVLILPMFATSLFSIVWMRLPGGGAPPWIYYTMSLLSFLVSVSIYVGLIRWARIKLLGKLKEQKGPRVLRGWLSPRMTAKDL